MKIRNPGRLPGAILLLLILIAASGCAFKQSANLRDSSDTSPLGIIIGIYQGPLDHLNAVRIGQCSMYPSCSHYAKAAIKKHGPVTGTMLACDRLVRCGRGELEYARKIPVDGKWRYYDPLSANDFWFYGNKNPAVRRPNRQ
ncbi:MAG: membrane protein insertion efficiency factor YidD [Desulfobacterales bacterium]